MKKFDWSFENHLKNWNFFLLKNCWTINKDGHFIAAKNKILRIFGSFRQNLDQNRGLIQPNNPEKDAQISGLSAKKAKNTPQPQNGIKKQENVKKWHFYDVFERFPVKIQPDINLRHFKKFKISFPSF